MSLWSDLSSFAGNATGGFLGESDEERRRKAQQQAQKVAPYVARPNSVSSIAPRSVAQQQRINQTFDRVNPAKKVGLGIQVAANPRRQQPGLSVEADPEIEIDEPRRLRLEEQLDKGASFEDASDQTGLGVEEVRKYVDKKRPGYGVKPMTAGNLFNAAKGFGADLVDKTLMVPNMVDATIRQNNPDTKNAYEAARGALMRGEITNQKFFETTGQLAKNVIGKKVVMDDKGITRVVDQSAPEFIQTSTDAGVNALNFAPIATSAKAAMAAKGLMPSVGRAVREGTTWGTIDTANDAVQGRLSPEQIAMNYALNIGMAGGGELAGKGAQGLARAQNGPNSERGALGPIDPNQSARERFAKGKDLGDKTPEPITKEALIARAVAGGVDEGNAQRLMQRDGPAKFSAMLESTNFDTAKNPDALANYVAKNVPDGSKQIGGVANKNDLLPEEAVLKPNDVVDQTGTLEPSTTAPEPAPDVPASKTVNEPIQTDAPLGKVARDFYESRKGNVKINFNDVKAMADTVAARAHNDFKAIGSDLSTVARTVQEHFEAGYNSVKEMPLTPQERKLWKAVQSEMDYMRRRSSLGGKEVSEGDFGDTYWNRMSKDAPPTREQLFQGFRDTKPGSEYKRKRGEQGLQLDEISYSPRVIAKYIIDHADTKLLQEERIARATEKNNPDASNEQILEATNIIVDLQNAVNQLKTKIGLGGLGRKVTQVNGQNIDFAKVMSEAGEVLGRQQTTVFGTPRGLTNGDRINSIEVHDQRVGDYLGLNQFHDAGAFAGRQVEEAGDDRALLGDLVRDRLEMQYGLSEDAVEYIVESVQRMKPGLDDSVVKARVEAHYRNAAKQQLMERLQDVKIKNNTLRKDVSDLANQIVREGTIESGASAKIVQATLRATNALFRKLNVSSALNELSDLSSFYAIYGKETKIFSPDFSLVKQMGLGELDPAIEPYLKQIEEGADLKGVVKKLHQANEATRLYKFMETYKAAVLLKTAKEFYADPKNGGLTGDALTARMLKDYRELALPMDAFTKTFLNSTPLYTQYLSWGARNMQKEARLLTGQIDAGVMRDKSTSKRIARDIYANLPAKTVFWLSSNGLKGTAIMTAVGLTDFTGLTSQDYSGIEEEDKNFYDKTTQFTNISTVASLLNTSIQAYEKEQLKKSDKYKDADYNPYEHANFENSLVNTYTPQFIKNAVGADELMQKGYSESKNTLSIDKLKTAVTRGKYADKGGRVQYEAPTDPYNIGKAFVFGKNQTSNSREYSGRENLVDRVNEIEGDATKKIVGGVKAVGDMAQEQIGLKETDYSRPITKEYSEKYKAAENGARRALLQGGQKYNKYLDDLKKNNPDIYKNYIASMDNHVKPEFWNKNTNGGQDLTTFHVMRDRKKQLKTDFGTPYDPLYDLPDDQAKSVLAYQSAATGTDLAMRNMLGKEQWYKDFKAKRGAHYDALPEDEVSGDFKETQRQKEWNSLDTELGSYFYDKDTAAKEGDPAWGAKFPLVLQSKKLEYGTDESKAFYRANWDAYKAEKEAYDKEQLAVINKMRKIENQTEMSWEGYQQATKFADTDTSDDAEKSKSSKGYYDSDGTWHSSGGSGGSAKVAKTGVDDSISNISKGAAGIKNITGTKGKLKDVRTIVKKSKRASGMSSIRIKI